jgi:hypothetical protein
MTFQHKGVAMGAQPPRDEYSLRVTDGPVIARVVAAVRAPQAP